MRRTFVFLCFAKGDKEPDECDVTTMSNSDDPSLAQIQGDLVGTWVRVLSPGIVVFLWT